MDELVRKVYDTIKKSEMICQGDSVIVGVSGGADSVCLLSVLKNLQMSMDLKLTAVHIHHGLRGEAADRDRDFVIQLCQTLHVPCECFQTDIREMAEEDVFEIGNEKIREYVSIDTSKMPLLFDIDIRPRSSVWKTGLVLSPDFVIAYPKSLRQRV